MLRYWQILGNVLIVIGVLAFIGQPIIGIVVTGNSVSLLTPSSALILMVLGVLIRIDCAIRSV